MTRWQAFALATLTGLALACGDDADTNKSGAQAEAGSSPKPEAGESGSKPASAGTAAGGAGSGAAAGSGGAAAGTPAGKAGAGGASGASAQAGSDAGGSPAAAGSGGTASTFPADGTNPNAVNPFPGYKSENYDDDKLWLCKPGIAKNYCLEDIADATEALPDGTFKPFMDTLGTDHPFDCIYWYPTVNRTEDPKSLDFSDPKPMLSPIRSQAARFSRVCNVYAPFYRQASLNNGGDAKLGYQDVVDGFKHYIANWNKGRYFVIMGHSQGTGHATKLISELVNDTPELRDRLISAVLIGGGVTPTTFSNIPVCTKADQIGCVIGYRSYGQPTPPKGDAIPANLACVNPAALMGGSALSKGAYFHSKGSEYAPALGPDFTANFGLFRNFFSAECKPAPSGGGQYLEINYANAPDDMRKKFLDLSKEIGFGTHVFDYNFVLDDLLALVQSQEAAIMAGKH